MQSDSRQESEAAEVGTAVARSYPGQVAPRGVTSVGLRADVAARVVRDPFYTSEMAGNEG